MYDIRLMEPDELSESLKLVRSVFMECEAPEYSEKGVSTFMAFTQQSNISQGLCEEDLAIWVCIYESDIIGVIAVKSISHICMLFVRSDFHRQGIGRKLLYNALKSVEGETDITVNSSPYAVPFYHAAGFADLDNLKVTDGIKFVPMSAKRNELII